jgi:hypothetical protein
MRLGRRNLDKIDSFRAKLAVAAVEVVAITAEVKTAIFAADKPVSTSRDSSTELAEVLRRDKFRFLPRTRD